jgi:hypothetical protein
MRKLYIRSILLFGIMFGFFSQMSGSVYDPKLSDARSSSLQRMISRCGRLRETAPNF